MKLFNAIKAGLYEKGSNVVPFWITDDVLSVIPIALDGLSQPDVKRLFVPPYDECFFEFQPKKFGGGQMQHMGIVIQKTEIANQMGMGVAGTHSFTLKGLEADWVISIAGAKSEHGAFYDTCLSEWQICFNYSDDGPMNLYPGGVAADRVRRIDEHESRAVLNLLANVLGVLNSPEIVNTDWVDASNAQSNRKFQRIGRKLGHTIIRLSRDMREYLKYRENPTYTDEMGQHWVRRHPHLYWTGSDRRKPVIRMIGPFKRGNPIHGEKMPGYEVRV